MGGRPSKNFLEEKLTLRFKIKSPYAEITEDKKTPFITASSFKLAKKEGEYGILIDDKKWYAENIYVFVSTIRGDITFPITGLDSPIPTSKVTKEEKIDAECSLVFNITQRGRSYPCILRDKVFRHNVVLKPKYETVANITEAVKL